MEASDIYMAVTILFSVAWKREQQQHSLTLTVTQNQIMAAAKQAQQENMRPFCPTKRQGKIYFLL